MSCPKCKKLEEALFTALSRICGWRSRVGRVSLPPQEELQYHAAYDIRLISHLIDKNGLFTEEERKHIITEEQA